MIIEVNGKRYVLSEEEIDAAYQYRRHEYRTEDAKYHIEDKADDILDRYGLTVDEAESYADEMADRYSDMHDCNIDENAIWDEMVVPYVLSKYSKKQAA